VSIGCSLNVNDVTTPKVAAAAAKRPEQIRIFVGAWLSQICRSPNDIGREQIIDAQSAFAGEMTDAAPSVNPPTPVVEMIPLGVANPNA
jgi:hypothetical protein